jgi:hypothetical protein
VGRAGLIGKALVGAASAGAAAATAHTLVNLRLLRVPPPDPAPVLEGVSVLLPLRDEAHRVRPCLEGLLAQERLPHLEILVLDDDSSDGTSEVVASVVGDDRRVQVLASAGPRPGWLGKPDACDRLATRATGDVLVFTDADVVLEPHALASAVTLLRGADLDLVSPYPRQETGTAVERLVQPLLQWSWLTFLPLRAMESSPRASLSAANGQLLVCDARAYRASGGHGAVHDSVLEDLALAKVFKRTGHRVAMADGTPIARCRMYGSAAELREGYAKSLWAAFGGAYGAAAVGAGLAFLYLLPPVAAVAGRGAVRRTGMLGTAAAVLGRAAIARRVGGRTWPDPLAQPLSVLALLGLTAESFHRKRNGTLSWKGRAL